MFSLELKETARSNTAISGRAQAHEPSCSPNIVRFLARDGSVGVIDGSVVVGSKAKASPDLRPPSLDMNHGFMKSILRNQIDRDQYDKERKRSLNRISGQNRKDDRPQIRLYVPPHRRKVGTGRTLDEMPDEGKSSDISEDGTEETEGLIQNHIFLPTCQNVPALFRFSVEDQSGNVHTVTVCRGDSAARITKIICQKLELQDEIASRIRKTLDKEIQQRTA